MRTAWLVWQLHADDGEFLDGEGDYLDAHNALIRVEHRDILDFALARGPAISYDREPGALVGVIIDGEPHWMSETSPAKYIGPHNRIGIKVVGRTLLVLESFTARRYALHVPVNVPKQKLYLHIVDLLVLSVVV